MIVHASAKGIVFEHRSPSNQVSIATNPFHFRRRFPICLAHHPVPRFKVRLRVWVFLPELFESASFYDAHGRAGSHNENIKDRKKHLANYSNAMRKLELTPTNSRAELSHFGRIMLKKKVEVWYSCCFLWVLSMSIGETRGTAETEETAETRS
jgi:hypothetical protein